MDLVLFLLVLDQVLSSHNSYVLLTLGNLDSDDLIGFPGLGGEELDGQGITHFLKSVAIIHLDFVDLSDKELAHGFDLNGFGPLEVLAVDLDFEVVHVLSLIDIEASLVVLVGNTIPDSLSEHALGALHVVIHEVLQLWLEGLFVYQVEVDVFLSRHLDPDVSLDVVNETSHFNFIVLGPRPLLSDLVVDLLEEQYGGG